MQEKKDMTGKLISLAFLGILAVVLTLFLAPAIQLGMSQQLTDPNQLLDVGGNLAALFGVEDGILIFAAVLLVLLGLVCAVVFMGGSSNSMTPQMRSITDKIRTPVPAGQRQHGSADWLPRERFSKAFGNAVINPKNMIVQDMLAHGADDLDFAKRHDMGEKRGGEDVS